ncbi:hypothetical protein FO519_010982, partial [Halicephalobus sp. NKZ332]
LVNLKFIVFNLIEYRPDLIYDNDEDFNISPSSLKNIVDYEYKLFEYNGKAKVTFNHHLNFDVLSDTKTAVEGYLDQVKNEFKGFKYSSEIGEYEVYHSFKKSCSINENFELNIEFLLIFEDIK